MILNPPPPCCLPLQLFPRHVIEFMSAGGSLSQPANLGNLARSHNDASILFMDICGAEEGRSCQGPGRKQAGFRWNVRRTWV